MSPVLLALAARLPLTATPEPGEVLPGTPPEELVTPGTIGFLVTFAVAVALVLLVRDMTRRNRRIVFEAERRDALAREEQERELLVRDQEAHEAQEAQGTPPATRPEQPRTVGEGPDGDGDRPAGPIG